MFSILPTAETLHQYTLNLVKAKVLLLISKSSEEGKFQCAITAHEQRICGKELREKGYKVEYNIPYGFVVKWCLV